MIVELKTEAKARGVRYQVLMRMFIIEGFQRLKKRGVAPPFRAAVPG